MRHGNRVASDPSKGQIGASTLSLLSLGAQGISPLADARRIGRSKRVADASSQIRQGPRWIGTAGGRSPRCRPLADSATVLEGCALPNYPTESIAASA